MIKRSKKITIESLKPNNGWVNGYAFEVLLQDKVSFISKPKQKLTFEVLEQTKLPLDTIVRLLQLLNQLQSKGHRITLNFKGRSESIGYLNRVGFFDFLHQDVKVKPARPEESGRQAHMGNSNALMELEAVNTTLNNNELPERISNIIATHLEGHKPEDKKRLQQICRLMFSELITNIHEHSKTNLDGFAALQLYGGDSPRAEVIVCDSGVGLMESLRPSLKMHNKKFAEFSDKEIIAAILSEGGISSKPLNEGAGNGLETCFRLAKKMNSDVSIRLKNDQFRLIRVEEADDLVNAFKHKEELFPLDGTFICFAVPLVKQTLDT